MESEQEDGWMEVVGGFDEFRRKTIDSFSAVSSPDISVVQCNVPQVQDSKVETALTDFSPENRQQNEEPSSFFPYHVFEYQRMTLDYWMPDTNELEASSIEDPYRFPIFTVL